MRRSSSLGSLTPVLLVFMILLMIVALAVVVLEIIAYWKLFKKAGEPGWKAVIPAYGPYTMFRLAWRPLYFWILVGLGVLSGLFSSLMLTGRRGLAVFVFLHVVFAVAMLVVYIIFLVKLAHAYGKGPGFAVGMVFLTAIFVLILAFGDSQYIGVPEKIEKIKEIPKEL